MNYPKTSRKAEFEKPLLSCLEEDQTEAGNRGQSFSNRSFEKSGPVDLRDIGNDKLPLQLQNWVTFFERWIMKKKNLIAQNAVKPDALCVLSTTQTAERAIITIMTNINGSISSPGCSTQAQLAGADSSLLAEHDFTRPTCRIFPRRAAISFQEDNNCEENPIHSGFAEADSSAAAYYYYFVQKKRLPRPERPQLPPAFVKWSA